MRNLIVLGMHRSGTSAVAGALAANGFYAGEKLLPADPGFNDTGFFEHEEIVAIHNEFFAAFDLDWRFCYQLPEDCFETEAADIARAKIRALLDDEYFSKEPWFIKDPRACVLFPLWREVLSEAHVDYSVLIVQRAPGDVAASLQRRNKLDIKQSLLLWLFHNLAAEKHTREQSRTFLDYEVFLENPVESITATLRTLGVEHEEISGDLGVERRFNHVGGSDVVCPEIVVRATKLLDQRPLDTESLDDLSLELKKIVSLLPDGISLERAAVKWREDFKLSQDHIRNIEALHKSARHELNEVERAAVKLGEDLELSQDQIRNNEALLIRAGHELKKEQVSRIKLQAQLKATAATVETLKRELSYAEESLTAISNSFFWRLTRPARACVEFMRRVQKARKRNSFHQIALKPENQIQLSDGGYVCEGDDAYFLLITNQTRCPEGRVEVHFILETDKSPLEATLSVIHGEEATVAQIALPKFQQGTQRFKLELPENIRSLRLDVGRSSGKFNIEKFTIRELF